MKRFLDLNNCMLDLETLGTKPGCVVVSLGACAFDGVFGVQDTFYRVLNIKAQLPVDLRINPETLDWWLQKDDAVRQELQVACRGGSNPGEALDEFNLWYRQQAFQTVWSNGADFDLPILTTLYQRFGREVPWKHTSTRCFRTLKNLFSEVPQPATIGTHHNALDDAVWQAQYAIDIHNNVVDKLPVGEQDSVLNGGAA